MPDARCSTWPTSSGRSRSCGRTSRSTPTYAWPLLAADLGTEVWVKHENPTPTGAFKMRGGLVLVERLGRERPDLAGIVSATRGNHGQSLAFAGGLHGVPVTIVVPEGNSTEKNAAMVALGRRAGRSHGRDFQAAREHAQALADQRGLRMVGPFEPDLVLGVATYALELFTARARPRRRVRAGRDGLGHLRPDGRARPARPADRDRRRRRRRRRRPRCCRSRPATPVGHRDRRTRSSTVSPPASPIRAPSR